MSAQTSDDAQHVHVPRRGTKTARSAGSTDIHASLSQLMVKHDIYGTGEPQDSANR